MESDCRKIIGTIVVRHFGIFTMVILKAYHKRFRINGHVGVYPVERTCEMPQEFEYNLN
jgi:hypothetical protein